MARRRSSRSSSRLSVAPTTGDVASVNEPATASAKNQHSGSDTPYNAGDNGETREETAAPPSELEKAQGSTSNARAESDSSGREIHVATRANDDDTPPTQSQGERPRTSTLRPDTNGNQDTTTGDHEGPRRDLDDGRLPDTTDEQDRVEPNDFKAMPNADGGRAYARQAEKEELTGWARFAEEVWTFEYKRMERWKDDINYLLLYAGLFSTALTGFIVPFYEFQAQAVDPTVQALALIAMQLNVIAFSVGHTDLTQQLPSPILPPPAAPAGRPLVTGILWTIALILSLGSGAIAIIVSQWLHHHVNRGASLDRQSARLWYFRYCGFKMWHVESIINVLPFMLQSAMILFLVGLIEQLWIWDRRIAVIATALVGALIGGLLATALIPVVAASSPFKSPQAWWWFHLVRLVHKLLLPIMRCMRRMLADADAIVTDVSFLEKVVRPCIQKQKLEDIEDTLSAYYDIMEHRAHHIDRSYSPLKLYWYIDEQDGGTIETLGQISVDVLIQISEKSPLDDAEQRAQSDHVHGVLQRLLEAAPWAKRAIYTRLMSLLPAPELHQEVLDKLVFIIWTFDERFPLDVEDTRRLLTFLPHARERLGTERFLKITCSAFQHSARLPPDDFGRVHSDICGALDVVIEYFNELMEKMDQADAWWRFPDLLGACVEVARVDTARPTRNDPLFNHDVVNALQRCASRNPEDGSVRDRIRGAMENIYRTLGYSADSTPNESISGETVSPAPVLRDPDEALREHT
ncbi:hypothetical protein IEO21_09261 [Rhodonia placenta]|uniref:DUF6535 domain-containing protein n=1 Tax=Rhodonia placenta TaxID=104341 RepID=A0A8H7NUU9_9APHY|nr:hypothetical protein IEO21_09261 [Postia placenta]